MSQQNIDVATHLAYNVGRCDALLADLEEAAITDDTYFTFDEDERKLLRLALDYLRSNIIGDQISPDELLEPNFSLFI